MKDSRLSIKDIAKKLGRGAKSVSEEVRERLPAYIELLKTLARLGKNISLDVDNGILKVREDFVNDYLSEVSIEDKGLRSIKISCEDGNASFSIELKKILFDGIVKMPFTVEHFVFNKNKLIRLGNSRSKLKKQFYKQPKIYEFITKNKTNPKNEDSLISFIIYLNKNHYSIS